MSNNREDFSAELFASAFQSIPLGVMIANVQGTICCVNAPLTALTGYTSTELVGHPASLLGFGTPSSAFPEILQKATRFGEHWKGISACRRKAGELYTAEQTVMPVRDANGQVNHVVCTLRQVLDPLKEAAEVPSRAKSEFLGKMRHEMLTPMSSILGMTELLLDSELTPDQRDILTDVRNSADSLLLIINDIIDFSKIEARRLRLQHKEFNLRDWITATRNALAIAADQKNLRLVCVVEPDVPQKMVGDAGRLRQILINLLSNGIKFTDSGEVGLRVERVSSTVNSGVLHFIVSDTGNAIPAEKRQLIFEAFTQADNSSTRKFGGVGLGLTIASQLVQMMNGQIWLESEVGKGNAFHFMVRLGSSDESQGEDTEDRGSYAL